MVLLQKVPYSKCNNVATDVTNELRVVCTN